MQASDFLGKKLTDQITGATGIGMGYCQYLSGCNQVLIVRPLDKDGKLPDGLWFDEQRLTILDEKPVVLDNSKSKGCDIPAPLR